MKKVILTFILGLSFTAVNAQVDEFASAGDDREMGTTTKSGQKILPQAGDFAIGVDALSLIGLGDNGDTPRFFYSDGFLDDENTTIATPTIYGKYFLSDQAAVRVKLHIGFGSKTDKEMVENKSSTETPKTKVEDKTTESKNKMGLTVGYEIRRGYGRLQGFFGPEVGIGFGSESEKNKYGNPYNKTNNPSSNATRLLEDKKSGKFYAKLGGFAGVEYFFAPKMSIGGEVGLGFNMNTTGKGSKKNENWDVIKEVATEKTDDGTTSKSNVNFKVAYASALNVTFYF